MQWTSIGFLVPGDLGILPLVAFGLLRRDRTDIAQNQFRRRLLLPAVVITVGSLLAVVDIGLTSWAVNTLVLDAVVTLTFLGLLAYARSIKLNQRYVTLAITAAGLFVSLIAIAQRGYRPAATFQQTNMTAHFLASCFVFTLIRATPRVRLVALPIMLLAVGLTSSFGALLSILAVLVWFGYGAMKGRMRNTSPALVVLIWAVLVGGLGFVAKSAVTAELKTENSAANQGLSQKRLDKSGTGRKDIWLDGIHALQKDPLGIGPGGFKPLGIHTKIVNGELDTAEIHHDFIGYLVERGYIGVLGLLLLYVTLWRAGSKRGVARGLLLMNLVAGQFRETLHFRHLWLFIALALAAEITESAPKVHRSGRSAARALAAGSAPGMSRATRLEMKTHAQSRAAKLAEKVSR